MFDKDPPIYFFVVFSPYLAAADGLLFTDTHQTHYYWTALKLQLVRTNTVKQMIVYFLFNIFPPFLQ